MLGQGVHAAQSPLNNNPSTKEFDFFAGSEQVARYKDGNSVAFKETQQDVFTGYANIISSNDQLKTVIGKAINSSKLRSLNDQLTGNFKTLLQNDPSLILAWNIIQSNNESQLTTLKEVHSKFFYKKGSTTYQGYEALEKCYADMGSKKTIFISDLKTQYDKYKSVSGIKYTAELLSNAVHIQIYNQNQIDRIVDFAADQANLSKFLAMGTNQNVVEGLFKLVKNGSVVGFNIKAPSVKPSETKDTYNTFKSTLSGTSGKFNLVLEAYYLYVTDKEYETFLDDNGLNGCDPESNFTIQALLALTPVTPSTYTSLPKSLWNTTASVLTVTPTTCSVNLKNQIDEIVNQGDYGGEKTEEIIDYLMLRQGYSVGNGKYFGDRGNNGLDRVYYKGTLTNPTDVIVFEAKQMSSSGTASLSDENRSTLLPIQMTDAWIDYICRVKLPHQNNSDEVQDTGVGINTFIRSGKKVDKFVIVVDKSISEIKFLRLANY